MVTKTKTNFKANTRFTVRYEYMGWDDRRHIDESIVRGENEEDAIVTLGGIIGRSRIADRRWDFWDELLDIHDAFCVIEAKPYNA